MKRAQFIINLITVIVLIIVLILLHRMITKSKYSLKYVKELFEKNTNTSNYMIEKEEIFSESGEKSLEKITQK